MPRQRPTSVADTWVSIRQHPAARVADKGLRPPGLSTRGFFSARSSRDSCCRPASGGSRIAASSGIANQAEPRPAADRQTATSAGERRLHPTGRPTRFRTAAPADRRPRPADGRAPTTPPGCSTHPRVSKRSEGMSSNLFGLSPIDSTLVNVRGNLVSRQTHPTGTVRQVIM